ncbi:hypothetical protein EV360DRAFT_73165 [Lentinula raphanica]|nr:hypothetical protein EV360DRAFT_73165 [Lentinula raphanica]
MTRFTFALILAFLALTVAPAILAAPISVRRSLKDDGLLSRRQPDGSGADGSAGSELTFEEMAAFLISTLSSHQSGQIENSSNMVKGSMTGDGITMVYIVSFPFVPSIFVVNAIVWEQTDLKGLAEKFSTANQKNLVTPVKDKDEDKTRAAISTFCTNHLSDLKKAKSDATELSKDKESGQTENAALATTVTAIYTWLVGECKKY